MEQQQKFSSSKLKYLYGLSPLYIDGATEFSSSKGVIPLKNSP